MSPDEASSPARAAALAWRPLVLGLCLIASPLACDRQDADPPPDVGEDVAVMEEAPRFASPPDFAGQVEAVRPAVVNIYTRTDPPEGRERPPVPHPGVIPEDRVRRSLGSGFLFDESGLVLTNEHVVVGASEIAVRLFDERIFSAEVVGADPPTDIAVLQLQEVTEGLPTVALGNSDDLAVGNWVLAIGNPLGLASTVTAGIASATGRQALPPGGRLRFQDFIQTDASINPGSSGGPLINTSAEVVGIATATSQAGHGLGFAIPINMVRDVLEDLQEYGRVRRSWLGIYVAHLSPAIREELELPAEGGALLSRLVEDGPAEKAGLQPGDVFLALDGHPVDDAFHLSWLAATFGAAQTVDVTIQRGTEELTVPITLEMAPEP